MAGISLYEVSAEILNCIRIEDTEDMVNTETGEVFDKEAFEKLQGDFNEKALGLAKWIKNLDAERKAIYDERKKLEAREKTISRKIESIKNYLDFCTSQIPKDKLPKDATTVLTRTKSTSTEVNLAELMKFKDCDSYLKYDDPKPDKTAIKNALKGGVEIPGCQLIEKENLQIK